MTSLSLRSSPTLREMKTGRKSIFSSSAYQDPSTVCAQSQLILVTIRTDCRSRVDLRGGSGVCLDVIKLEIIE